jgi:hypothetical protein
MRLRSVYVFTCLCSHRYEVESDAPFVCQCGRRSEIAWGAEAKELSPPVGPPSLNPVSKESNDE